MAYVDKYANLREFVIRIYLLQYFVCVQVLN